MALFRNHRLRHQPSAIAYGGRRRSLLGYDGWIGINLRDRLCGVPMYVSAQSLDFLDLANSAIAGLNWKLTLLPIMYHVESH